jgi:hypothetical protein
MKKKRLTGITILSIYMFAWSPISIFLIIDALDTFSQIKIIAFALCSIICGIALFRLANWGRKLTVIYFICSIIYGCLYFSPVLYKQRIQDYEKIYKRRTSEKKLKHRFDNEISKKEYLTSQLEWLEERKKKKFNLPRMLLTMIWPGILILSLCNPRIKEQFEEISTVNTNTSAGGV